MLVAFTVGEKDNIHEDPFQENTFVAVKEKPLK